MSAINGDSYPMCMCGSDQFVRERKERKSRRGQMRKGGPKTTWHLACVKGRECHVGLLLRKPTTNALFLAVATVGEQEEYFGINLYWSRWDEEVELHVRRV